jgi:hypothetical protein
MIRSLIRSKQCRQIGQVELNISVNGTAGTPVASGPDAAFVESVVDNGTGSYTITFKEAAQTALHPSAVLSLTARAIPRVSAVTTSSVTVVVLRDDNTAMDADFTIQLQFASQLSYYF